MPVLFVGLALAIAAGGYVAQALARQRFLTDKGDELRAIADLKVSQLTAWRAERLGDARAAAADPLLVAAVRDWLVRGARAESGAALQSRLDALLQVQEYERISLVDAEGGVRLTAPRTDLGRVDTDEPARQARASAVVSFLDLHRPDTGRGVHLELVAPLRLPGDPEARPVAFLEFLIDPQRFLYPHLQAWPTPSRSAESLLVRREGDELVFLNELRHRKGSALALRLPVTRPDSPVALAVLGKEGIVEGRDYRGHYVLAALRRVPESPWFLVSKVDHGEIVAPLARDAWLIGSLGLALIALTGLVAQRFRRREQDLSDAEFAESAERLRLQGAALGAAANAVLITDRNGKIVWVNDAFSRLTGWSLDECRGRTPRILKSGRHDRRFYEEMWQTVLEGRVWQQEMTNRRKDGALYIEEQTITPVTDERGEITHFVAIKVDIGERKRAEEALRQSEARYRTLAEASQDEIAIVDQGLSLRYVNGHAAGRLGRPGREIEGLHLGDLFPPALVESVRTTIDEALSTKQPVYEERELPLPAGRAWFGMWIVPLDPAAGSVMVVARDITEHRRAQQTILKEKAFSEAMINSLPGICFLFDHRGRFLRWNQRFEAVSGYSADEIPTLRPLDFFAQEDRTLLEERIRSAFETGGVDLEASLLAKDGKRTPHYFVGVRIEVDGTPCCISMGIDLTARKHLEEQLRQAQKMEAIGLLASGVAHDFNNLLGVIGGYSELVLQALPPDHPQRKRLEAIRRAGERAAELIRQLLAFGRKQSLEPVVLDPAQTVSGMKGMLRRLIPSDIELVDRFGADAGRVKVDPSQLEQVILNLAVNARDAMPDGGRLVIETSAAELSESYCQVHPGLRAGRYVLLSLSDTGTGMDTKTQDRVFEPFFTTKEPGKGTGLGLSTVYGIVKQHEGHIAVYSEPGRGTTFKVYLPRVDAEPAREQVAPSPAAQAAMERRTVLLVEDNEDMRLLSREMLEAQGHQVLEAHDGEAALELCARHPGPVHLLLTDMVMPRLTGRQLAERLRSSRSEMRVLFVSGYAGDMVVREGDPEAGMTFLQKPFTPNQLGRKIRELMRASPRPGE